jgi:hypothetical protein
LWLNFQIDQTNAIRVARIQHPNRLIVVNGQRYEIPEPLVFRNPEISTPLRAENRRLQPEDSFLAEIISKPVYDAGYSISNLTKKYDGLPSESHFSQLKRGSGHFRTINQIVENCPTPVQVRFFIHLLDTFGQLGEFFLLRDQLLCLQPQSKITAPTAATILNTAKLRLWLFFHFAIQAENESVVTVKPSQGLIEVRGDRVGIPTEFYGFKLRDR